MWAGLVLDPLQLPTITCACPQARPSYLRVDPPQGGVSWLEVGVSQVLCAALWVGQRKGPSGTALASGLPESQEGTGAGGHSCHVWAPTQACPPPHSLDL